MKSRNPPPIELSSTERSTLESWSRAEGAPEAPTPLTAEEREALAHRAAIVLAYADGERLLETMGRLETSEYVVLYWRKRFKQSGPLGLMSKMGRPKADVELTAQQRRALLDWQRGVGATASVLTSEQRNVLGRRASIILASADGEANNTIAKRLGMAPRVVKKWRDRFLEFGTTGLLGNGESGYALRHGAAIAPSVEEQIRELARNSKLSTRAIAREVGVSQGTVSRTLRRVRTKGS